MTDSLSQLDAKRNDLFRQLAAVGDFRRGSVTTTSGKCGKSQLSLRQTRRPRPRAQFPPDAQSCRQDHH